MACITLFLPSLDKMPLMIDIDNQSGLNIPIEKIEKIAQSLTDKDIDLLVTDNTQMRQINAEFRGIDKATDVLSFPFEESPMAPLGTLAISADYVKELSLELKHSQEDEFCLLFIHGLLHLLGYDHETDKGEMREKEKSLIETFGLPHSLIIRTEEI
jgi:probable rRNA maturation factor